MSRCKLCSTAARVPAPSLYRDRVGVSTYEFGGHKHLVCNKCGFYLSHSSYSWSEYPVLTQLSALAPPAILWAPCFCFQLQSDWRIQFMNNKLSNLLTGSLEGFLLGYILGLLSLVFHQRLMFSLSSPLTFSPY